MSTMAGSLPNGSDENVPNVNDSAPTTSNDAPPPTVSVSGIQPFDFESAATVVTGILQAASTTQKTLRFENENLKVDLVKLKRENNAIKETADRDGEKWLAGVKELREKQGAMKKNWDKAMKTLEENVNLQTEIQNLNQEKEAIQQGADIACGRLKLELQKLKKEKETLKQEQYKVWEAQRKENLQTLQQKEDLKAEMRKLKDDKAAVEECLSKGLAILGGTTGSQRKPLEEGIAKLGDVLEAAAMNQANFPCEPRTLPSNGKGLGDQPDHVDDGVKAAQDQYLQSELQKLRGEKAAAEKKAADEAAEKTEAEQQAKRTYLALQSTNKQLEKDLKAEKSNHLIHAKKVREELGAKHKEEVDALHLNYKKEMAIIGKTNTEVQSLRQEKERLRIENKGLNKTLVGAKKAKEEAKALREQLKDVQTERDFLRQDLKNVKTRLDVEVRHYNELQDKINKLEEAAAQVDELNGVREELVKVLNSRDGFKERCTKLEKEISDLETEVAKDRLVKSLREQVASLESKLSSSEAKIVGLEQDRDNKAPLVEKGAAIRMRFLAQAENSAMGFQRHALDSQVVREGNDAAHRGDGYADAALFKAGFLHEEFHVQRFRNVYGDDVGAYLNQGPSEGTEDRGRGRRPGRF